MKRDTDVNHPFMGAIPHTTTFQKKSCAFVQIYGLCILQNVYSVIHFFFFFEEMDNQYKAVTSGGKCNVLIDCLV